ncbi:MAG: DUF58 domain-containing protein [Anaerolineaceae bacterium]|nr:DUF58 domain-containing protein [Anaerolineaceae bacterium]
MAEARVFDERTLRRLEQVMLWSQRARAGAMKGERRSIRRGTSIEFADYRDYAYGDDLRRLDWNVYARLQRPYIKLLEDEEDLALHILIDASVSMDWPAGEDDAERNKFRHAQRLAAGLAWCALASNDRTQLYGVSGAGSSTFGPHRGRGHNLRLLDFIAALQPAGEVDLDAVLREQALRGARPGLFVLISDMYTPVNLTDALNELAAAGHELLLLHLLSPEELEPPLAGDLRLIDVESGGMREVSVDGALRERYAQGLDAWRAQLRRVLLQRGGHYLFVNTDTPWERVILRDLRGLGVVR